LDADNNSKIIRPKKLSEIAAVRDEGILDPRVDGRVCRGSMAPPDLCAMNVTTLDAALKTKNGVFSMSKRPAIFQVRVASENRRSSQKSSSKNKNGVVTNMGLLMRPQANQSTERRYDFFAPDSGSEQRCAQFE